MAPGPKKKSFLTPRNNKNTQNSKSSEKKNDESVNESIKTADTSSVVVNDSEISDKKYSKRSVENNWNKYDEPQIDPHADSIRGKDFNVLLSYSGGSGSQFKLQDDKEWEDEALNMKEMSLNLQELVNCMKCIPFHERMGLQNIFDEKQIENFKSSAEKWKLSLESQPKQTVVKTEDIKAVFADPDLNIVEEQDSFEADDYIPVKNVVQDKTETIIDTLASSLSFEKFIDTTECEENKSDKLSSKEKDSEATSSDLDFLLSLNISSKLSIKEENSASKNTNVDDWLNSILDD